MKSTGQTLKQRREALNVSLAEVSIATKITPRMLQAMESADMDHLPARTFLRGFVKSYAGFLKMDVDQVLKDFNAEFAAIDAAANPQPVVADATTQANPEPEAPARQPTVSELIPNGMSKTQKISIAGGIGALIALIFVVFQLVQKYEKEGQVDQELPPLTSITEDSKKAEKKPVEAKAPEAPPAAPAVAEAPKEKEAEPPTPAPTVAAAATAPAPEADKPKETPKPVEAPKPVETAKPAEVAKPVEAPKPAEVTKPVEAAKPAATAKPGVAQEIIIEALDKVEITFSSKDGAAKKVSLAPSQVHTIKAVGPVAIEMSDGGAVNIIHNGRDVGVPGDLGRPKKMQFP